MKQYMNSNWLLIFSLFLISCSKDEAGPPEPDPVSPEGEMVIEGGGQFYSKKVFVDLSENKQLSIDRTGWDLGFYTGTEFRVILNSSTGMMARKLDKSDITAVSAADTAGFIEEVSFNAFSTDALAYIDYPDGDLNKTAIAEISSNADDNKVYILNRGAGVGNPAPERGWKKIRVLRNSNGGYTLQHGDINATTFTEVQLEKSGDHYFRYVLFENGEVEVEPEKDKWDFAWTYFSNVTSFGGGEIPYPFQDFIITNRNVQTAMVKDSVLNFENFVESDLNGLTFVGTQNSIGADWRAGGGPSTAPAIRTDRYYIVKDANGNYYKIKFTSLTRDGERGYPSFEFKLVKKATS
ncbi:MAG: HmuY family protein [Chitinophagaceae bacterium]|nr:HmuY family protein [Chitinophagaceae bacterium]